MRYGDELELPIEKLAFEGKAIAHAEDLVIFVEAGPTRRHGTCKNPEEEKEFCRGAGT